MEFTYVLNIPMLTFIIIKRGLQCKAGRERFLKFLLSRSLGESESDPISLKNPAPQYQHIDRKKRMGKNS